MGRSETDLGVYVWRYADDEGWRWVPEVDRPPSLGLGWLILGKQGEDYLNHQLFLLGDAFGHEQG